MPLASSGLRTLKGAQAHLFPPGGGTQTAARAIHIPAAVPRPTASHATSTAQTVIKHTRTILSRFVAHLTTPDTLRAPADVVAGASHARAFHGPATRMPSIHERMSYSARQFLSRPPVVPFLPRAPGVPRNMTQVGLGTARKFSTGRPVFQHLAENVPIYARAFSEADWKVRMQEERERLKLEKVKAKAASKQAKKMQAPLRALKAVPQIDSASASTSVESHQDELEHYFPAPSVPEVVTHLLIPLAPTPTSRLPLSSEPPASHGRPLLPLDVIASMHTSHGTHALRISSLFARLDAANVLDEPGILCEARGDPSGLCTVLEVRFDGWTANRVRGILGEAGTGWCAIEEVWNDKDATDAEEMDAALDTLSVAESEGGCHIETAAFADMHDVNGSWGASSAGIDPAHSFVLPTLDFSASFAAPAWSPPTSVHRSDRSSPLSDVQLHNEWSEIEDGLSSPGSVDLDDFGSDVGSVSSEGWHESSTTAPRSDSTWFAFSSRFSERLGSADEPRENMF
ncbi:hypothetical protein BD413DRAFT_608562 [Trametes elegans]|nr:hypothetical protein BD413DRAFT_608562 [Trametes elegans]